MGVDYAAAIWVGLPREQFTTDELRALIENDTLEVCPPYYDGNDADYAIVGFSLCVSPDYCPEELVINEAEIFTQKAKFKELTGLDAKLYLSPYGS